MSSRAAPAVLRPRGVGGLLYRAAVASHVALLRGINVGGRNVVRMADLRALCERLGLERPRTHLQSGNVVFDANGPPGTLAERLEEAIERDLGLRVRVVVRTARELAEVVARDPLRDVATDPARYVVLFLAD